MNEINEKANLAKRLEKRIQLVRGRRWRRMAFAPGRYLYGQFFQKLIFPRRRQSRPVTTTTFWGGDIHLLLPASMDIFLLGVKTHDSELRLSRFLIQRLKPGDQVADIGAHYGFFSLLSAQLVGFEGRIEAFEAAADTFRMLFKNLRTVPQATAHHLAVAQTSSRLDFYEFPNPYSEYNTFHPEQFSNQDWFAKNRPTIHRVSSVSLDDFCRRRHFRPDLIKIDVEGAEDRVVEGMREVLAEHRPLIVMEYLAEERYNQAHRRAAQLLSKQGLQAFYITESGELVVCSDIEAYFAERKLDSDNLVWYKF